MLSFSEFEQWYSFTTTQRTLARSKEANPRTGTSCSEAVCEGWNYNASHIQCSSNCLGGCCWLTNRPKCEHILEQFYSGMYSIFQQLRIPLEYWQLRLRAAIERVLIAVQGQDPQINSAPKIWAHHRAW